ncbi:MAG: ABC transporter permease [Anaerolineae bacterium]|nr:ABC transporter permease [Anaerolineae bacterium]
MLRRILTIAWKEFLHLRKDRILVPFVILGAISELTLIAWATGQPIQNIDMTIVDQDHSDQSAALIQTLEQSKVFDYRRDAASAAEVEQLMAQNGTYIGIVIPPGYGAALLGNQRPDVQVILNGADALTAYTAETTAQELITEQSLRDARGLQPADYENELPKVTVRYNEDLDRAYYTLPAEMSFMFYMMTLILAAFAIARERERGTYEQLQVMPYRSSEVVIGKLIAPMVIGYGLFLLMLALTTLVFHVPFRGSLPLLLVLAVIYLIAEIGKGIFLSMTARTQLQAVMMVVGVAMVDMIFSGYAVAVETMSPFMQAISNIFAIRHWLTIVRGIMLKGVGLDVLWPSLAAIVIIGAVILSVTFWAYRRSVR